MSHIDQHEIDEERDLDAVSRRYRAAREGDAMAPPAALDDAIRAAAHRAVHAGPKLAGASWLRRWTPQLAVAAVVVLSVSVVFVSIEERPDLAPASIQKIALNHETAVPPEAAPPVQTRIVETAPKPVFEADRVKKKSAAETDAVVAENQAARQKADTNTREERRAQALPPPPALTANIAPAAPAPPVYAPPRPPAELAYQPAPVATSPAPAPFPASVAEAVAPARKEARADTRVAAAETRPVAQKEEKVTVTGAVRSRDALDAPAASPATLAPAAQGAVARAPVMKQLAPVPAPAAAASVPATTAADSVRANAHGPAGAGISTRAETGLADKLAEDQRPGPWLKRLLALREQGKFKELRDELVRFRKAHPDVVLPKSLTELPAP